MEDPFKGWNSNQWVLDEILYRDPPRIMRQIEIKDGVTHRVEWVVFADGSRLAISAQVPLPPMEGMTPAIVTVLKPNGERREKMDDGSSEVLSLASASIAMRFLEKISKMLDDMPESAKMTCPDCSGEGCCPECNGAGCPECNKTGLCQKCSGHGKIIQE